MHLLFLTPHVDLWSHTVPEAFLARSLEELGHEVSYLTCGKAQTYCSCMTARRLSPLVDAADRDAVCRSCMQGARLLSAFVSGPAHARLVDYLDLTDLAKCRALAEAAVRQRSLDTMMLGVPVGRLALYEFTLFHKKMSVDLTDAQWAEYGVYLENGLRSLQAFSRHVARHRPDVVFAFSPQYSNLNPCLAYARTVGIRAIFLESGTNLNDRLSTMRAWDWSVHGLVNPALSYWEQSESHPVDQRAVDAVAGHFRQLLRGQHFAVFSAPYAPGVGIRARWNIRAEQKIALMTLSSYDEAYAALLIGGFPERKVFSDIYRTQAEWMRATLEWARSRPDIFFVVRVHPRDFPNKRDSLRSEQSFALESILQDVPGNVHVNWPAEGVSLYEVIEDVDVLLTGWSVTALEAMVVGIPVVTYDRKLPSYPADIMHTGSSEAEYFANIDAALTAGWRIENVRHGFRWFAYNFLDNTVEVSSALASREVVPASPVVKLTRRVLNKVPQISRRIDLSGWRAALPGARVLDHMLRQGFDAVVAAKVDLGLCAGPGYDDAREVDRGLRILYDLLYGDTLLPQDKPGLAKNIRAHLGLPR